jgi:hypothetical protein
MRNLDGDDARARVELLVLRLRQWKAISNA